MSREVIAVVAAHPDDEILGCGGAIARFVAEGKIVHVLILAEGITARDENRSRSERSVELSVLTKSAEKAHQVLGSTTLEFSEFPDNRMDSCDRLDVVKVVEQFINQYKATVVFTHHFSDVNIDHSRVHEAVITACRPIPGHSVKKIFFFEVASSTEWRPAYTVMPFMPNYFLDISKFLTKKVEALQAYSSEMREFPHARSIEALDHLAKWRGASVGVLAAEAFVLGRGLE